MSSGKEATSGQGDGEKVQAGIELPVARSPKGERGLEKLDVSPLNDPPEHDISSSWPFLRTNANKRGRREDEQYPENLHVARVSP